MRRCLIFTPLGTPLVDVELPSSSSSSSSSLSLLSRPQHVEAPVPTPEATEAGDRPDVFSEGDDNGNLQVTSLSARSLGQLIAATAHFQSGVADGEASSTTPEDPLGGEGLGIRLAGGTALVAITLPQLLLAGLYQDSADPATVRLQLATFARTLIDTTASKLSTDEENERLLSKNDCIRVTGEVLERVNRADARRRQLKLNQMTAWSSAQGDSFSDDEDSDDGSDLEPVLGSVKGAAPGPASVRSLRELWRGLTLDAVRSCSEPLVDQERALKLRGNDAAATIYLLHCPTRRLTAVSIENSAMAHTPSPQHTSTTSTGLALLLKSRIGRQAAGTTSIKVCDIDTAKLVVLAAVGGIFCESELTSHREDENVVLLTIATKQSAIVGGSAARAATSSPLSAATTFKMARGHIPGTCLVVVHHGDGADAVASGCSSVVWTCGSHVMDVSICTAAYIPAGVVVSSSDGHRPCPPARDTTTSRGGGRGGDSHAESSISAKHQAHRRVVKRSAAASAPADRR